MSQIFNRQFFTELWITLSSNETLGILDSDYLEDYFGTDGQVSLYNVETDEYFPVLMNEVISDTPSIPHDVFTGYYDLNDLENGTYQIRGRVKDVNDNYTILSAFENPIGSERIILLELVILTSQVIVNFTGVTIMLGSSFTTPLIQSSNFTVPVVPLETEMPTALLANVPEFQTTLQETEEMDSKLLNGVTL